MLGVYYTIVIVSPHFSIGNYYGPYIKVRALGLQLCRCLFGVGWFCVFFRGCVRVVMVGLPQDVRTGLTSTLHLHVLQISYEGIEVSSFVHGIG